MGELRVSEYTLLRELFLSRYIPLPTDRAQEFAALSSMGFARLAELGFAQVMQITDRGQVYMLANWKNILPEKKDGFHRSRPRG